MIPIYHLKCVGLFWRVAIQQIPNANSILQPISTKEILPNKLLDETIAIPVNAPTVSAEYKRLSTSFIINCRVRNDLISISQ